MFDWRFRHRTDMVRDTFPDDRLGNFCSKVWCLPIAAIQIVVRARRAGRQPTTACMKTQTSSRLMPSVEAVGLAMRAYAHLALSFGVPRPSCASRASLSFAIRLVPAFCFATHAVAMCLVGFERGWVWSFRSIDEAEIRFGTRPAKRHSFF